MTAGSRSTNTARGTCFPEPVSLKKVLKESSPPPMVLSLGILPSGWIPCSKQYNSQHALPICTPAWPTWMEMHSRCTYTQSKRGKTVKMAAYPPQWAPGPQIWPWVHDGLSCLYWRRCWKGPDGNRTLMWLPAAHHQVQYHAPDRKAPSTRYLSECQLGPHGLRCTLAVGQ